MKKVSKVYVSLIVLVVAGTSFGYCHSVSAQGGIPSTPEQISEINSFPEVHVRDLVLDKMSYKAGDTVSGSFTIVNSRNFSSSNISYRISLVGDLMPDTLYRYEFDSKTAGVTFLAGNEYKTLRFSYVLPISSDAYSINKQLGIKVRAFSGSGIPLGWADSKVSVVGSGITPVSVGGAFVSVAGRDFRLNEGPIVHEGEKAVLKLVLSNTSSESVEGLAPKFSFYGMDYVGTPIKIYVADSVSVSAKGKKAVEFDLPTFEYVPGVYAGEVAFFDGAGIDRSGPVRFRYIVAGELVNIQNVSIDKTSAREGEDIVVSVVYSGSPYDLLSSSIATSSSFDLSVKVINEDGDEVAIHNEVSEFSVRGTKNISLKTEGDAWAFGVEVIISKDGKIVDVYKADLVGDMEKARQDSAAYFRHKIVVGELVVVLVLVLVGAIFSWGRSRKLFVLIGLSLLGFGFYTNSAEAFTVVYNLQSNNRITAPNILVNSPSGVYTPGSTFYLTGSTNTLTCSNSDYNIKIYWSTNGVNWSLFKDIGQNTVDCPSGNRWCNSPSVDFSNGPYTVPSTPGNYRIYLKVESWLGPGPGHPDWTIIGTTIGYQDYIVPPPASGLVLSCDYPGTTLGASWTAPVKTCSASWPTPANPTYGPLTFSGVDNVNNLSYVNGSGQTINDARFLCLDNRFYACGWEMTDLSIAQPVSAGDVVGSWTCGGKSWSSSNPSPTSGRWDTFYLRANKGAGNGTWPSEVIQNDVVGTSSSFSSLSDQAYHVWVSTRGSTNNSYSVGVGGDITCASSVLACYSPTDTVSPAVQTLGVSSLSSNTYGYYTFDSNVNNSGAVSYPNNVGSSGAAASSTGKFGGSYYMSGTNSYINYSSTASLQPSGKKTFSLWIKPSVQTHTGVVFSKYRTDTSDGGYFLQFDSSNRLSAGIKSNSWKAADQGPVYTTPSSDALVANQWAHVAVTIDTSSATRTIALYVNGDYVGKNTVDASGVFVDTTAPFLVGAEWYGPGDTVCNTSNWPGTGCSYKGSVDDLFVVDKILSDCEIKRLAKGPNACNSPCSSACYADGEALPISTLFGLNNPALVSYWNFDANANDSKGVNNGTKYGAVAFDSGKFGNAAHFPNNSHWFYPNSYTHTSSASAPTTDDRISIPDSASLKINSGKPMTWTAWVKGSFVMGKHRENLGVNSYRFASINDWSISSSIGTAPGSKSDFYWDPHSTTAHHQTWFPLDYSSWHHIAVVLDKTNNIQKQYIDGVLVSTSAYIGTPNENSLPFEIGINRQCGNGTCNGINDSWTSYIGPGWVDDLALWNVALSDCEIKKLALGPNGCNSECGNSCSVPGDKFKITTDTAPYSDMNALCKVQYGSSWEFATISNADEDYILTGNNGTPLFPNGSYSIANQPNEAIAPMYGQRCTADASLESDKQALLTIGVYSPAPMCYADIPKDNEAIGICHNTAFDPALPSCTPSCYDYTAPVTPKPLSQIFDVNTSPNLFAYFPFDHNSALDSKGNISWVINNAPNTVDSGSKFDGGALFDATHGPGFSSTNLNFGTGDFSICTWFKETANETNGAGEQQEIIGMRNGDVYGGGVGLGGLEVQIDGGGNNIQASVCADGLSNCNAIIQSPRPTLNTWYHLCFVRGANDSSNGNLGVKLYKNGIPVQSINNTNKNINYSGFMLGDDDINQAEKFVGQMDDLAIWKRAISECEVRSLYLGTNVCLSACTPATSCYSPTDLPVPLTMVMDKNDPTLDTYLPLNNNVDNLGSGTAIFTPTLPGFNLGSVTGVWGTFDKSYYSPDRPYLTGERYYSFWNSAPNTGTVSMWIYMNNLNSGSTNSPRIFGAGNKYECFLTWGGNQVQCDLGDAATLLSNINLVAGRWYHFAVTWDQAANRQQMWIDGVLVGSSNHGKPISGQYMRVGDSYSNIGQQWKGKIDDVSMFTRVLSDCEIKRLAKGPNACEAACTLGPTIITPTPHEYTTGTASVPACGVVDISLVPVLNAVSYKYYTGLSSTTLILATTTTSTSYTDYSHTGPGTFYYANKVVYAGGVESATSSVATTTLQACTIAECGTKDTQSPYSIGTTAWPSGSTYCSVGTSTTPAFPTISNNPILWSCLDNRGQLDSCSATLLTTLPATRRIMDFYADRAIVASGQKCYLNWNTTYDDGDCVLNGGGYFNNRAVVASSTSPMETQPIIAPTTYTLSCSHSGSASDIKSLVCRVPGGVGEN